MHPAPLPFRGGREMIALIPNRFTAMKIRFVLLPALLCVLTSFSAQAQSKSCDTGTGWYSMHLWEGYVIQLQPDSPGKYRATLLSSTGEIFYRATGDEGHIEFAATGIDVNNDGKKDAVLEIRQGDKYRYAVLTPGQRPALQREFLTSIPLRWEDHDGDGRVEIIGYDQVFEGIDGIGVEESPHPMAVFRLRADNTPYPVSQAYWPEYEAEINHAKANMPKEGLYQLQGAVATAPDHEKSPEEEHQLRDAKALALKIVINYLYAGRTKEAFQYISDNWTDRDKDRIRQAILTARSKGIMSEIAKTVTPEPIPDAKPAAPAQSKAEQELPSSPAQALADKLKPSSPAQSAAEKETPSSPAQSTADQQKPVPVRSN